LIKLFVLVAVSPIKSSHASDLLPLSQAEGGCSGGKVTSIINIKVTRNCKTWSKTGYNIKVQEYRLES